VKASLLICGALLVSAMTSPALADEEPAAFDLAAGEALYKKSCRRCHGPTAKGMASFPKLVGQTPEYLIEKLEQYRAGEKVGANTALMAPNAKSLSDEDIVNISQFISSIS